MLGIALFGPFFAPYSPTEIVGIPLTTPNGEFLLGTDNLGRDVLSRVLWGGRSIIGLAVASTLLAYLIGGAIGSTTSAITNAAYLFATHPRQAELLRADRDLTRPAVEEVLRYAPPFRSTRRKALEPVDVAGLHFEPDQAVLLSRQAANRDPARFERPHEFDIRRGERNHATFGHGAHFCLGQALARANLAEAIPALVERCHDLEIVGTPLRVPFDPVEKFDALHLCFTGAPRR